MPRGHAQVVLDEHDGVARLEAGDEPAFGIAEDHPLRVARVVAARQEGQGVDRIRQQADPDHADKMTRNVLEALLHGDHHALLALRQRLILLRPCQIAPDGLAVGCLGYRRNERPVARRIGGLGALDGRGDKAHPRRASAQLRRELAVVLGDETRDNLASSVRRRAEYGDLPAAVRADARGVVRVEAVQVCVGEGDLREARVVDQLGEQTRLDGQRVVAADHPQVQGVLDVASRAERDLQRGRHPLVDTPGRRLTEHVGPREDLLSGRLDERVERRAQGAGQGERRHEEQLDEREPSLPPHRVPPG